MITTSKKIDILDHAQTLIQTRGYNGFSFADIADEVGIRKASIHHYFPSKAALGTAVIRRYRETFQAQLDQIATAKKNGLDTIKAYAKLYQAVLDENKLCLCGMLATDNATLPRALKKEIRDFFSDNVAWLVNQLSPHYKILTGKRLKDMAWQVISSLQGALMLARTLENQDIFFSITKEIYLQFEQLK